MNFHLLSIALFLLLAQAHSQDNDKLFRIFVNSPKDAELVYKFRMNNSELVDLWSEPRVASVILAQLKGNAFQEFKKLDVQFEVANKNITRVLEESVRHEQIKEIVRMQFYKSMDDESLAVNFDLNQYHSYKEIENYMKSVAKKSNATLNVRMITIGRTAEYRDIFALTISKQSLPEKKKILVECGIHAREWVAGAACLKMIDKFVIRPDKTATAILNKYDVHIIPILNPDGFEYSRVRDRSWRKNRSKNFAVVPFCRGVDINRNFDAAFGTVGVDAINPCSLIYCGKEAFSEKESMALRDYVHSIKDSLHGYISLHSFSQLLLYPYGISEQVPANNDELKHLAALAQDAIYSKQGEIYHGGNIYTAIYPASGGSLDWVALNTDCKYNFCFEMRDTGEYGFILPERLINPAFEDIWIGTEQLILNMQD